MKEIEMPDDEIYSARTESSEELGKISEMIENDRLRYSSRLDIEEEMDEY